MSVSGCNLNLCYCAQCSHDFILELSVKFIVTVSAILICFLLLSLSSTVADDCGPLDPPTEGSVSINGTIVGSTATYTCNDGFTLQGGSTRTCQTNGQWSGSAPICQRKLDVANLCTHAVLSSTNIVPTGALRPA